MAAASTALLMPWEIAVRLHIRCGIPNSMVFI
jgi:hypothetical protein